jgi:hypothetical protein
MPDGFSISWSTQAFTLLISAERADFMPSKAARTMVSSDAGSRGGVSLGGPVGVVEVGWEVGGGVCGREKVDARRVSSAGEGVSAVGGASEIGPSSSVVIGVSDSSAEGLLYRSRTCRFFLALPLARVLEEIGDGFGCFSERTAEVNCHEDRSSSALRSLTLASCQRAPIRVETMLLR